MFSPTDDGYLPTNDSKKSWEQVGQDQSRTPPGLDEPSSSVAGSSLHDMKNSHLMSLQRDKEEQKNTPSPVTHSSSAEDSRLEGLLDEVL